MNPLLKLLRTTNRRAGAPTPAPVLTLGGRGPSGWCSNVGSAEAYAGAIPFANLVRESGGGWTRYGGPLNWANAHAATGWLQNMPVGEVAELAIFPVHSPVPMYTPPGDYVITSASGVFCTVSGTGLTNIVQGTNAARNATFTIPDLGPLVDNPVTLFIAVNNGTAAVIPTINDVYCGTLLNKASHDSGKWWDLKFRDLLTGSGIIRWGDMMGRNNSTTNRLDVPRPTEANMAWAKFDPDGTLLGKFSLPLSAAVKFSKEINAGVWLVMPSGREGIFYDTDATTNKFISRRYVGYGAPTFATHGYTNGTKVKFYSYNEVCAAPFTYTSVFFVVNATANDFQLSATLGGAPIALTQTINDSTRAGLFPGSTDLSAFGIEQLHPKAYYQTWLNSVLDEVYAIYPDAQMVIECGNESWNPLYERYYYNEVVFRSAQLEEGITFANENSFNNGVPYGLDWGAIGYAWLQMLAWKAIEVRFGRSKNTRLSSCQLTYFGNMAGNLRWKDPGILTTANTTYYKDIIDGFMVATYIGMDTNCADAVRNLSGLTWTDDTFLTHFRAGNTQVAADCQLVLDNIAAQAPGRKLYTYEAGVGVEGFGDTTGLSNIDLRTFAEKLQTWLLTSQQAATWANDFIARVYVAKQVQNMQHWAAGGWLISPPSGLENLSAMRSYQTTPTPYQLAMRSFRLGAAAFSQVLRFASNTALADTSVQTIGSNIAFTADLTGAVDNVTNIINLKADGIHDVTFSGMAGGGFDNTRNRINIITFTKVVGGVTYSIVPGAIVDLDGPVMLGARVDDVDPSLVVMPWDEELRTFNAVGVARPLPAATAFTITGSTVTDVFIGLTGDQLCLRLAANVPAGTAKTLSFINPTGLNPLQDFSGNNAANFSAVSITNNILIRTVLLQDDFTIKPNGPLGAPQIGTMPVNVSSYGGDTVIGGGALINKTGTGVGSTVLWDIGSVSSYTIFASVDGNYTIRPIFRAIDEGNHIGVATLQTGTHLFETVGYTETIHVNADTRGVVNEGSQYQAPPYTSRIDITPTEIRCFDSQGEILFAHPSTFNASATKVGFKVIGNGPSSYNIKVVSPAMPVPTFESYITL